MSELMQSGSGKTSRSHMVTRQETKRRERLREHLFALPYPAFEQLITQLLHQSGYAYVHIAGRKHKRGRFENVNRCMNDLFKSDQPTEPYISRHNNASPGNPPLRNKLPAGGLGSGGFDLRAYNHTDIATALTVVQIKQYRRTVSRRFVDELRGTMLRLQATHGLLITTSDFSRVAQQAAEHSESAPIRLLDGNSLLDLLIQHRIAVRTTRKGWKIDRLWLDNLAKSATSGGDDTSLRSKNSSLKPTSHCVRSWHHPNLASRDPSSKNIKTATHEFTKNYPFNCIGSLPHSASDGFESTISDDSGGSMLWRTHVLTGISSLWFLEIFPGTITPDNISLLVAVAAFGSLLPDLDAAESKIKHLSVKGMKPFYFPARLVHRHFTHRGLLHSLSGLSLLAFFAGILGPWWGWSVSLALVLGYASHLFADACTHSGIRWLFPRPKRYYLLPPPLRFITGSPAEEILLPLLAMLGLSLLLRQLFLVYSF